MLGHLLREVRERRNLSQRDVAKQLDRTQAFIWKIEHGIQHIDLPTLIDLAAIYEASAADLVKSVEEDVRAGRIPADS